MFTYRFPLFRLLGFQVSADASWALLAILIVWSLASVMFPQIMPGLEGGAYLWMAVLAAIGFFGSIVLHELSHSVVARRFDIPIDGITLFIFGGVAEMREEPKSAKAEFLMAVAGPAMSFVLAGLFLALAFLLGGFEEGAAGGPAAVGVVARYLGWINLALAIFNLVPAFPLDGGRMLRAALWARSGDALSATRTASRFGSAFGVFLIVLAVLNIVRGDIVGGIWLFMIGMFVRQAAQSSFEHTAVKSFMTGHTVRRFMRPEPDTVPPETSLRALVDDWVYTRNHRTFPVVEEGRLLGLVSIDRVRQVEPERWAASTVSAVMEPIDETNTIEAGNPAAKALEAMHRTGRTKLLVVEHGRLVGIITLRDLMEFLAIRLELGPDQKRRRGARAG